MIVYNKIKVSLWIVLAMQVKEDSRKRWSLLRQISTRIHSVMLTLYADGYLEEILHVSYSKTKWRLSGLRACPGSKFGKSSIMTKYHEVELFKDLFAIISIDLLMDSWNT